MSTEPLPPAVASFLDSHIATLSQLDVLLLLREAGGQTRSIEDLSRASYLPARSLAPWLAAFARQGLVQAVDGGYRFAPEPPLRDVVHEVANCYARRHVSVARHLYASREDRAIRLADAFRFRSDPRPEDST